MLDKLTKNTNDPVYQELIKLLLYTKIIKYKTGNRLQDVPLQIKELLKLSTLNNLSITQLQELLKELQFNRLAVNKLQVKKKKVMINLVACLVVCSIGIIDIKILLFICPLLLLLCLNLYKARNWNKQIAENDNKIISLLKNKVEEDNNQNTEISSMIMQTQPDTNDATTNTEGEEVLAEASDTATAAIGEEVEGEVRAVASSSIFSDSSYANNEGVKEGVKQTFEIDSSQCVRASV